MKDPTPALPADLSDPEHPAYWAFRGWCAASKLHYTEVWHPTEVEGFLSAWNALTLHKD